MRVTATENEGIMKQKRTFVDAPQDQRCQATLILKDRSTAQCGRYSKVEGFCRQHKKLDPYQAMSLLMRVMDYLQRRSDDLPAQSVVHAAYIRVGRANVRRNVASK